MARDAGVRERWNRSVDGDVTYTGGIENARVECHLFLRELHCVFTQRVTDRAVRIAVARDAI